MRRALAILALARAYEVYENEYANDVLPGGRGDDEYRCGAAHPARHRRVASTASGPHRCSTISAAQSECALHAGSPWLGS